jgi:hypothetical protein
MAFKDALGASFFNTSSLLRSPPQIISRLVAAEKSNDTDGARLLTLDGYHPHKTTRAALISEIMNHYVLLWGPPAPWNGEEESAGEGSSRVVIGGGGGNSAPLLGPKERAGAPQGVITNPLSGAGGSNRSIIENELSWISILGVAVVVFIGGLVVLKYGDSGESRAGGAGKVHSSPFSSYSTPAPPSTTLLKGKKAPPSWARLK